MKNIPILTVFILMWLLTAGINAFAQFPQGPSGFYSPYPPVLSQPIDILPKGFITIRVGDETYYYYDGIFYQKTVLEQKYVAVPPPIGAIVFTIPQGYQLMLINGLSYYEYQGVFYIRVLEGYRVIFPPEPGGRRL